MNKRTLIAIMLLSFAFSAFAFGNAFKLAQPEFRIDAANADVLSPILSVMATELRQDLARRSDIEFANAGDGDAAKLSCAIKEMKSVTTLFKGSTYKAWNTRLTIRVGMELAATNGKAERREFTIIRRLRSTSGEPKLDDTTIVGIAKDIVNQCYEELPGMVESINNK